MSRYVAVGFFVLVTCTLLLLLWAFTYKTPSENAKRHRRPLVAVSRDVSPTLRTTDDSHSQPKRPSLQPLLEVSATTTGHARRVLVSFDWPTARLGNKMFQYAATLGVALFHGLPLIVMQDVPDKAEGFGQMKRLFQLTDKVETSGDASLLSAAQHINEPGWGMYNAAVEDASTYIRPDVTLMGYIQSWKYFARSIPEIRRQYTLNRDYAAAADAFLRKLKPTRRSDAAADATVVYVGVHVRRGDMLNYPSLYSAAPASYLAAAMKYYVAKFEPGATVFFVVATDDWPWVSAALSEHRIAAENVAPTQETAEMDFAVLSRCNHSIITGGTFGWWSAFLAGGKVIYFKDFITKSSGLFNGYREEDYYLPSWIGLT